MDYPRTHILVSWQPCYLWHLFVTLKCCTIMSSIKNPFLLARLPIKVNLITTSCFIQEIWRKCKVNKDVKLWYIHTCSEYMQMFITGACRSTRVYDNSMPFHELIEAKIDRLISLLQPSYKFPWGSFHQCIAGKSEES